MVFSHVPRDMNRRINLLRSMGTHHSSSSPSDPSANGGKKSNKNESRLNLARELLEIFYPLPLQMKNQQWRCAYANLIALCYPIDLSSSNPNDFEFLNLFTKDRAQITVLRGFLEVMGRTSGNQAYSNFIETIINSRRLVVEPLLKDSVPIAMMGNLSLSLSLSLLCAICLTCY